MKNIIKKNSLLALIAIIVFACGGSDDSPVAPNQAPSSTQLVYPSANQLCIDSTIPFEWTAATDPDSNPISYNLVIAKNSNLTTDIVEQVNVIGTSRIFTLEKEVAYYWQVTPKDSQGALGEPSPTYAFYTQGTGVSNYAPFAAALSSPAEDSFLDAGFVDLVWTGGDANAGDILIYNLYFGETTTPPLLQGDIVNQVFNVTVNAATTYYWRIDTIDNFGIKTIGQLWSFNVN